MVAPSSSAPMRRPTSAPFTRQPSRSLVPSHSSPLRLKVFIRGTVACVRMSNPNWHVARLDDIERRDRDIPVREHFGIRAFGVNAYAAGEDGTLIGEHDEAGSGQEELYVVLDGKATFEIDGE